MRRAILVGLFFLLGMVPQACQQDDVLAPHPPELNPELGSSLHYKIAYASRGDIYVMNPDGTATRLTDDATWDGQPSWSPDGSRLTFYSNRDGHSEIYAMMADGSAQTRVTNTASWVANVSPSWSPDGTKIAFSSDGHIYVMNADGSGRTQLSSGTSYDNSPSWSPDGSKIAFSSGGHIYVMNADGSAPTGLTDNPSWDGEPSWAPDGRRIAFSRDGHIYVVSADGSAQTQLTNASASDAEPSWSPDGRQIAFATNRSNANGDIYLINADGSNPTRLTYVAAGASHPSWLPNGVSRGLSFVTEPPESVEVSVAVSPPLRVAVTDSLGNPVPGATDSVTLVLGTNLTGATLQGTTKVAAVDGVATFTDVRLDRLGRGYTLAARAASLAGAESNAFAVYAPARLVFVTQPPQNVEVNAVLSSPVRVAVEDASGGPLPGATDTVTLTLSGNPGAAVLLGTTSVVAQGGIATFADLRVDRPVSGVTLTATAPRRTPGTSAALTVHVTFASAEAGGGLVGGGHSCGVTTSGAAYCWGDNYWGQAGTGPSSPDYLTSSAPVVGGLNLRMVSVGGAHTCGVTTSGAGYCWGFGFWGQRGDGSFGRSRGAPAAVAGGLDFSTISAGGRHTCGLTTQGKAYCWGQNLYGQLGDAQNDDSATPARVAGRLSFTTLSAGGLHTCGVTVAGRAYCWGENSAGQLGDGTNLNRPIPAPVVGRVTFVTLSAGGSHTCGLTKNGTAYCWGSNSYGQLGDGTTAGHVRPVRVAGGLAFATIRAGDTHTCGVTTSGGAYCWGNNGSGRLGDGTTTQSAVPVPVAGGLSFTTIRAGATHTCGIAASVEGAYCWGSDTKGELGTGTQTASLTPVRVVQ
jgi:alpha-tubulin suppressor-like RCC1 family protein/sugar lactone lactonase YvrE